MMLNMWLILLSTLSLASCYTTGVPSPTFTHTTRNRPPITFLVEVTIDIDSFTAIGQGASFNAVSDEDTTGPPITLLVEDVNRPRSRSGNDIRERYWRYYNSLGISRQHQQPFHRGHPRCNDLQGLHVAALESDPTIDIPSPTAWCCLL